MTESDRAAGADAWRPHEFDHRHGDVSGGWLRASTFGAMDGLVSNTALIAGVGAAAEAHTVILSGFAGLVAGAFSMALGEFASVSTANEQIESEVRVERRAFRMHPQAERAELVDMLVQMGMTQETAAKATDELHRDENRALNFHLSQELGVDPREKPSPWVGGDLVVLDLRGRCHHPAGPVPARLRIAVGGLDPGWCGSDDRRWRRVPLHQEAAVVGIAAAVGLWRHRDRGHLRRRHAGRYSHHVRQMLLRVIVTACLVSTACAPAHSVARAVHVSRARSIYRPGSASTTPRWVACPGSATTRAAASIT